MQRRWICTVILHVASAGPQIHQITPSFSDVLYPSNLIPDSLDSLVSCGLGLPADSQSFDISGLIARTATDSEFTTASADLWDLEDAQNIDNLWSSSSLGETSWLPDLTIDREQLSFNEDRRPNDLPSKDICSGEQPLAEEKGGWEPPWIPIDPGQPDRDCLDDDWEKFCCPLGVIPLVTGTSDCVQCKA